MQEQGEKERQTFTPLLALIEVDSEGAASMLLALPPERDFESSSLALAASLEAMPGRLAMITALNVCLKLTCE